MRYHERQVCTSLILNHQEPPLYTTAAHSGCIPSLCVSELSVQPWSTGGGCVGGIGCEEIPMEGSLKNAEGPQGSLCSRGERGCLAGIRGGFVGLCRQLLGVVELRLSS